MDWINIASTFGIPVVIIAAIGWFLVNHVWPFVTNQITSLNSERREERKEFLEALSRRDAELAKVADALDELTTAVRDLRGDSGSSAKESGGYTPRRRP